MNKETEDYYLTALLQAQVIDEALFHLALYEQNLSEISGMKFLVIEGYLEKKSWYDFCNEYWNVKPFDADNPGNTAIDMSFIRQFEQQKTAELSFMPISYKNDECTVLTPFPWLNEHTHYLRKHLNFHIQVKTYLISYTQLLFYQNKYATHSNNLAELITHITHQPHCLREQSPKTEHPVIRLGSAILEDALENNASDVHFEPSGYQTTIRYRVDGVLRTRISIHSHLWQALSIRFKVLANVDITEKRFPQEGSFSVMLSQQVDVRLSVVPSINGEHFVLRFLRKETHNILDNSGVDSEQIAILNNIIAQPSGMIVIAGPTGSGKSTTLYGLLQRIDNKKLNIVTLEDPVEQRLSNVRQIQVNEENGLGFYRVLKSVLRQDPDVIFIGEMRDEQTATLGIKASMTGHLVLTTIHADDTAGVFARMQDLKVSESLLHRQLKAAIAQRLMRKLCTYCKGTFCKHCAETGYHGRFAIMEIIDFSKSNKPYKTLHEAAIESVDKGLTDFKEVKRVLGNVQA